MVAFVPSIVPFRADRKLSKISLAGMVTAPALKPRSKTIKKLMQRSVRTDT
jgi:hypothetical protein